MKRNSKKEFVIRARCAGDIKTLLQLAASALGLDESDVIRLAIRQYAASVISAPPAFPHGAR